MGNRILQRLAATIAVSLMLASASLAEGPRFQAIPPAKEIVADGHTWTILSGKLLRNGVPDTASGAVVQVRYWNGAILRKTCFWYKLTTKDWPAGDAGWLLMPTMPGEVLTGCPHFPHYPFPSSTKPK
jgi:hypothetical protein